MNYIYWPDVALTIVLLIVVILGFLYELAGEMVPGFHTISFSAHKHWFVRLSILAAVLGLFILLAVHFASTRIYR